MLGLKLNRVNKRSQWYVNGMSNSKNGFPRLAYVSLRIVYDISSITIESENLLIFVDTSKSQKNTATILKVKCISWNMQWYDYTISNLSPFLLTSINMR